MILNSYNFKKSLLMKKRKEEYKNSLSIIPVNNMYTLTGSIIEKRNEYVEEIKKVETKTKKKRPSLALDLSELDMIDLPKLKDEGDDDDIVIVNKHGSEEED